jgi:hypothetical protein
MGVNVWSDDSSREGMGGGGIKAVVVASSDRVEGDVTRMMGGGGIKAASPVSVERASGVAEGEGDVTRTMGGGGSNICSSLCGLEDEAVPAEGRTKESFEADDDDDGEGGGDEDLPSPLHEARQATA